MAGCFKMTRGIVPGLLGIAAGPSGTVGGQSLCQGAALDRLFAADVLGTHTWCRIDLRTEESRRPAWVARRLLHVATVQDRQHVGPVDR